LLVAAVVAFIAMTAIATSPVHAQASDPFDVLSSDNESVTWPPFSDELNHPQLPALGPPPGWLPNDMHTSSVSAPLPQAIATGLFMLGGNWVVTRMWKKRKI
jgi:hypothetical protein